MRVLTSALFALFLTFLGSGQGFGRFGYANRPQLPGFQLATDGFTSRTGNADKVLFGSPARQWKTLNTSESGQTVLLNSQIYGPQKLRYNLWQPGFSLYFEGGMKLRIGSIGCPYLTWPDGTTGEDLPTPDVKWVLISFRTAQPPLLLVLDSGTASFVFKGRSGAWTLSTDKPFTGWLRVIQPLGAAEIAANSAAALGHLTKRVFENVAVWTLPVATPQGVEVKGDATSVEATWTFDKPGAVVPLGAALASVGGYGVKVQSRIRRLSEWNEEGPIAVCEEPVLKIRFPIRRIPLGRSIAVGKRPVEPLGTVSPIDIPSVVELALENLLSSRDQATLKTGEDALADFLSDMVYTAEPQTGQKLPYNEAGAGIDLAACHALLMQSVSIGRQASSEANSLLTSVSWRLDSYRWTLAVEDATLRRRAAALAAVAGFLCPEPERRLQAAMFEAGLAAERGVEILRARKSGKPDPKMLEPLDGLRRYAFMRDVRVADEDPYGKSLLSEVRVFGDASVSAEMEGEAIVTKWQAPDTEAHQIVFASAYPIDFELGNMKSLDVERALGLTQVRFVAQNPGPCYCNLRIPEFAKRLPAAAPVPRYSEPVK